jgi:hypothetical protein
LNGIFYLKKYFAKPSRTFFRLKRDLLIHKQWVSGLKRLCHKIFSLLSLPFVYEATISISYVKGLIGYQNKKNFATNSNVSHDWPSVVTYTFWRFDVLPARTWFGWQRQRRLNLHRAPIVTIPDFAAEKLFWGHLTGICLAPTRTFDTYWQDKGDPQEQFSAIFMHYGSIWN